MFICSSTPRSDVLVCIHMYMQKNLQLCIIHYLPPPPSRHYSPPSLTSPSLQLHPPLYDTGVGGGLQDFCTITFLVFLINDVAEHFSGAPNNNFRKIICSEDDLRSRIFGSFSDKFLACLPLLGFSNFIKIV